MCLSPILHTRAQSTHQHAIDTSKDTFWRTEALNGNETWGLAISWTKTPDTGIGTDSHSPSNSNSDTGSDTDADTEARFVELKCDCTDDVWDVYVSLHGVLEGGMFSRDVGGLYTRLEGEKVNMSVGGETGEWLRFQGVKLCPGSKFEWAREPARNGATERIANPEEHNQGAHNQEQHSTQAMTSTPELKVLFQFRGKGGRFDVSAHM